jgi:phage-related protein
VAGRKIGEAFVRVRPDLAGFTKEAEHHAHEGGLSFGRLFSASAAAELVSSGIEKVVEHLAELIHSSVEKAREAVRIERITAAAIKSTGGAAGVTAEEVEKLAERLGRVNGIEHDLIQQADNLLLTFTKVRNSAGEGNDIFDQTTAAIIDMTAAMNKGIVNADGLQTATIQIGKALQDPIKGITALRRVGVSFDDQQKEQIKKWVSQGKLLEAQKLILKELRTEFGGVAAAATDPLSRAGVAWTEFKEKIGKLVLPTVMRLGTFMSDRFIPFLEEKVVPAVQRMGRAFTTYVVPVIRSVAQWVGTQLMPHLIRFGDFVAVRVLPVLKDLGHRLREDGAKALGAIREAIKKNRPELEQLGKWFMVTVKFILEKLLPVIGPMLTVAIHTLGFTITLLVETIGNFVRVINASVDAGKAAWHWLQGAYRAVAQFVTSVAEFVQYLLHLFVSVGDVIRDRIKQMISDILSIPGRVLRAVGNLKNLLFDAGKDVITGLWEGIKSLGPWLGQQLSKLIDKYVPAPVRRILDLGSPSKLFKGFGRDTIRGYWEGVKAEQGISRRAMFGKPSTGNALGGLAAAMAAAAAGGGRGDISVVATADNKAIAALLSLLRFAAREVVSEDKAKARGGVRY